MASSGPPGPRQEGRLLHVTDGEEALAISLSAVCTAECPRDKLFSISLAAFSRIV